MTVPVLLSLAQNIMAATAQDSTQLAQWSVVSGALMLFILGHFLRLYGRAIVRDHKKAQRTSQLVIIGVVVGASSAFSSLAQFVLGNVIGSIFGIAIGGAIGGIIASAGGATLQVMEVFPPRLLSAIGTMFVVLSILTLITQIILMILTPLLP